MTIHRAECRNAKRLRQRDAERFIAVDWADEPVRSFEAALVVTVNNGKGVLANVASALARAEADIVHVDMDELGERETIDLRFIIAVRDRNHLDAVMRALRRTGSVAGVRRRIAD